uniref:Uncharacterized protein n=1 Tax=Firmicutes phage HS08 TaxID=3056391 RepID=A0AA49X459_9VIRU|nr:MAG: hypothetical protein [Firmicutes phage HS08]
MDNKTVTHTLPKHKKRTLISQRFFLFLGAG